MTSTAEKILDQFADRLRFVLTNHGLLETDYREIEILNDAYRIILDLLDKVRALRNA